MSDDGLPKLTLAEIADEIASVGIGGWEGYHFQEVDRIADAAANGRHFASAYDEYRIAEESGDDHVRRVRLCNGQEFRVIVEPAEPEFNPNNFTIESDIEWDLSRTIVTCNVCREEITSDVSDISMADAIERAKAHVGECPGEPPPREPFVYLPQGPVIEPTMKAEPLPDVVMVPIPPDLLAAARALSQRDVETLSRLHGVWQHVDIEGVWSGKVTTLTPVGVGVLRDALTDEEPGNG